MYIYLTRFYAYRRFAKIRTKFDLIRKVDLVKKIIQDTHKHERWRDRKRQTVSRTDRDADNNE